MAQFPCIDDMAKKIAEAAMDEYEYKGKTIRQWIDTLVRMESQNEQLDGVIAEMENALERVKNVTFWDTSEPDTDFYDVVKKAIADGINALKGGR